MRTFPAVVAGYGARMADDPHGALIREHLERTRLTWHGARRDVPAPDPADLPPSSRAWSGPQLGITADRAQSGWPASEALSGAEGVESPPSTSWLASIFEATIGVTGVVEVDGVSHLLRAAASVGNGHAIEAYIVCGNLLTDLPAGVHHVDPTRRRLTMVRAGDHRAWLAAAAADPGVGPAAATIVFTAVAWRQVWRYGERGARHVLWDLGAVLANLVAHGVAHGTPAGLDLAFDDHAVTDLLGIDEDEVPLAVCPLGHPWSAPEARAEQGQRLGHPRPVGRTEPALLRVRDVLRLGRVDASQVATAREQAASFPGTRCAPPVDVPVEADFATIEDLIAARRSARSLHPVPVSREAMEWMLSVATAPSGLDLVGPGRRLTTTTVVALRVAGRRAGRHDWGSFGLEPIDAVDLADDALTACMEQRPAVDAAALVISTIDLDAILEISGPRGLRAAHVEAAITGSRLQLAANVLGLGATSLTFLDAELRALAGRDEHALFVTAVGQLRPSDEG